MKLKQSLDKFILWRRSNKNTNCKAPRLNSDINNLDPKSLAENAVDEVAVEDAPRVVVEINTSASPAQEAD